MLRTLVLLAAGCGVLSADGVRLNIDFEDASLAGWIFPKAEEWKIGSLGDNHFLRLVKPGAIGEPRRPLQYALRQECVSDFSLRVRVSRTGSSKSLMIPFGYQDTLHFYYAHISADPGSHRVHNGFFKVDGGERVRIAGHGSAPVLPDQGWHEIRVVREAETGRMELYAGGESKPRFQHVDTSFRWGRVGVGSFNETGDFDDFRLEGRSSSECR